MEVHMRFDGSHPVASVAARLCRGRHGHVPTFASVACSDCWEAAVMADKEAAAEAGLSEICPADPDLVDEVAVARAVAGEPVELTVAEWKSAKVAIAEARGVRLRCTTELLAGHVTVVDALGNRLEAYELIGEMQRRPRRRFPRSRWAADKRRATRPHFHLPAAAEAA
jgi:hypothetical protein